MNPYTCKWTRYGTNQLVQIFSHYLYLRSLEAGGKSYIIHLYDHHGINLTGIYMARLQVNH